MSADTWFSVVAGAAGVVAGLGLASVIDNHSSRSTSQDALTSKTSHRVLMAMATSVAFIGVVGMCLDIWRGMPPLPLMLITSAFLYLAAVSIALALIDVRAHRLPNRIVLPAYFVLAALFLAACIFGAPWNALVRAGVAAAALFFFYWLLRAARSGGMGGGDVKLAGVLGMALGWAGWGAVIVGAFSAFLIGGLVGIALMLTGRATRKSALPFGPFMVIGAWIGIVAGESIAGAYVGIFA